MNRGVTLPQTSPGRPVAASDVSASIVEARAQTIVNAIAALRTERDEHLARGRLALAGECAPELERLRIELARLRIRSA